MWGFQHFLSTWHMGDEFFWQCKKARTMTLLAFTSVCVCPPTEDSRHGMLSSVH